MSGMSAGVMNALNATGTMAATGASDNIEEVARLIATREQARLQKDWTLADTLRTQLSTMGITLYDKTQSWKSNDGRSGRIPTFNEIDGGNLETVVATMAVEMAAEQPMGM